MQLFDLELDLSFDDFGPTSFVEVVQGAAKYGIAAALTYESGPGGGNPCYTFTSTDPTKFKNFLNEWYMRNDNDTCQEDDDVDYLMKGITERVAAKFDFTKVA